MIWHNSAHIPAGTGQCGSSAGLGNSSPHFPDPGNCSEPLQVSAPRSESVQPLTLREVGGEGTAETSRDLRIFLGLELVVQPEPEPERGSLCPACYSEVLSFPLAHPRLPASGSRPREDCRRTPRQALSQEESWLKSEHLDFEEVWLFWLLFCFFFHPMPLSFLWHVVAGEYESNRQTLFWSLRFYVPWEDVCFLFTMAPR